MTTDSKAELRKVLLQAAQDITLIEEKATLVLHEHKDSEEYRSLMRKKAQILASLHDTCQPAFAQLPSSEEKDFIQDTLKNFSKNASTALELDSVFYMSALLYPDGHVAGTPNDLDMFIKENM